MSNEQPTVDPVPDPAAAAEASFWTAPPARPRPQPASTMTPPSTLRIEGYEILECIGQGGMGVVYRARQTALGRIVAIKLLAGGRLGDPVALERFQAEAKLAATLLHPHIVQIFEFGQCADGPLIAMEYVEGRTLADSIRGQPQPARPSAELVAILAAAVQFAHAQGVVHRDLKPTNVLIGDRGQVKLADFGLAKQLHSSDGPTRSGEILGTPSYMAPEQASGAIAVVGPRTDVYALGAILYEMLTGGPPFRGADPVAVVLAVLSGEPVRPRSLAPGIPLDLETICLKCLQKSPRDRYESAQALADDLGRFLNGESILASPPGIPTRALRWVRRRPAMAALLTALAAGTAGFLGYSMYKNAQLRDSLNDTQRVLERSARNVRLAIEAADRRVELTGQPTETQYAEELEFFSRIRLQEGTDDGAQYERALAARSAGDVLRRMGRTDESISAYRESQAALEALAARHPDRPDYRRDLAAVLNQAGVVLESGSEFAAARQSYQKARDLLSGLLSSRPEDPDVERQLASVWNNEGRLSSRQGDLPAAEANYREAVRIREKLVATRPQSAFIRELMENQNNLAVTQGRQNKHAEAVEILNQAVAVFGRLTDAQQREAHPRSSLATVQLNLAANLGPLDRLDEAVRMNRAGIQSLRSLIQDFPEDARYLELCADAEVNLGKALLSQEKLAEALQEFEAAESRYRRLSQLRPTHPTARESADRLVPGLRELREAVESLPTTPN